ncbi:kinase-like domain-containing protein [Cantharellus anzutake]|uniref:kinase-like domain-containing protein n=1 Tax=Cantharellus anzutake TaxID=1750568 RepID=UPI00190772E2|nr:kinase-like domain-containing protein [Cantharellus anzutake]KAF8327478.1 kinase-like domain-containing protein [Cantharellus anzutake]
MPYCRSQSPSSFSQHLAREMKVWGRLRHENIARLYGYIAKVKENVLTAGFVSPWCQNGTITTYLKSNPRADRFTLFRDVSCGLRYLHTHEPPIVHGDIKPDNVVIGDNERALITDFGLSKIMDGVKTGQTSTNFAISGSPRYMAPELMRDTDGKPLRTPKSDIWAYGCTSMQILVDKPPYAEKNNLQVFHCLLGGQSPYDWDLNVEYELVFSMCCHQEPSDRPTIGAVVEKLAFSRE